MEVERKRKSRFDIPPAPAPDFDGQQTLSLPQGELLGSFPATQTASPYLTFGQKFGYGFSQSQSQPIIAPSSSPFALLSAEGMGLTMLEKDPQEEVFKEKLRKALQKNLDYLRRSEAETAAEDVF
jgi:hypothetical protein